MHQEIKTKLQQLGIPFASMDVFGRIKLNVIIRCQSSETANKWASALAGILKASPRVQRTTWEAVENKGTSMQKTQIKGYMISVDA